MIISILETEAVKSRNLLMVTQLVSGGAII